ncbi:HVO_2922 family protein [Halobacteriaceae archaeon GCM10025711]
MPAEPVFELYQDRAAEWRWRLVASNGNIIADSAEGYASKQGAERGIQSVKDSAPGADVRLQDDS